MAQYAENKPTADVLMSSMRSMGYTFEAAVCKQAFSAECIVVWFTTE